MRRDQEDYLKQWYKKPHRKPLIIRGARQVGKSTLVRLFCQKQGLQLIEIDFERSYQFRDAFSSQDPQKILLTLEILKNTRIDVENSLLFLDEIQAYPKAIATLRYFYEQLPQLPVIAAGSLLEFALEDKELSMPVGRIEYLYMGPMNLEEFIEATDGTRLLDFIRQYELNQPIPQSIHERAMEYVHRFILLGGMPEVIEVYKETGSFLEAERVKFSITGTYADDFAKYGTRIALKKVQEAYDRLIMTVGKKIKYVDILPGERSYVTDQILTLFTHAKLLYRVCHSHASNLPLRAEISRKMSKGILLDIGLYLSLCGLSIADLLHEPDLPFSNRGELAEQFVGQHLLYGGPTYMPPELFYWKREQAQSNAEVDFLIQLGTRILPIEVKAGKSGAMKSLHLLMATKGLDRALRFCSALPGCERIETRVLGAACSYTLVTLPFYLIGQTRRLLDQGSSSFPST
jgi:uncharacterized protein